MTATAPREISRREWAWLAIVAGLIVLFSSLPFLAGALAAQGGLPFTGALPGQLADYHSYLAKMAQGYRGGWTYQIIFTTEPHPPAAIFGLYLLLGHVARLTALSLPLTFHLARVLLGFWLLTVVYRFVARFVTPVRTRRVAFLLASTSAGLGWLTETIAPSRPPAISPIDFWLSDAYIYHSMMAVPHFSLVIGLLLTITLLLLPQEGPRAGPGWPAILPAAFASILLGMTHTYMLLVVDLPLGVYWLWFAWRARRREGQPIPWRGFLALAVLALVQMPILAYNLALFTRQPVYAAWAAQNLTLSPPPRYYLLGYGALWPLALAGAWRWARQGREELLFLAGWMGLVALLVYLPWNLQRRFLEGVQVPLGLLAGVGLAEVLVPLPASGRPPFARRLALPLIVSLMAMSSLVLTLAHSVGAASQAPAYTWPADVTAAVAWLGQNSAWPDTVLASNRMGSLIAGSNGQQVVSGHEMETIHFPAKQADIARFFAADTPLEERQAILGRYGVRYVFYGAEEQALGRFDPATMPSLRLVFHSGSASVYRMVP